MPLSKCPRCEKLFDKSNTAVCPKCREAEEADFDLIRVTLDDSPQLNADQVAEVSGVAIGCVMRMLDTGGVANKKLSEGVKCTRCGAEAISATKKLCRPCLDKLNQGAAASRGKAWQGEKKPVKPDEADKSGAHQRLREKRRR